MPGAVADHGLGEIFALETASHGPPPHGVECEGEHQEGQGVEQCSGALALDVVTEQLLTDHLGWEGDERHDQEQGEVQVELAVFCAA